MAASLFLVFACAFVIALGFTALAIRLGLALGIADAPGGRRRHARLTSRLGALPLFAAFTSAATLSRLLAPPSLDPVEPQRFNGLLLGSVVVCLAALLDDRFNLPAPTQLVAQLAGAGIAIAHAIFIERFTDPLTRQQVVLPLTFGAVLGWGLVFALSTFWFLGMMNTVNLLDGVDGLAASVGAVASAVTFIHMWREGQHSVALLPVALLGTLAGFLIFNTAPARIFLGGGALYLGYLLACIGIIGGAKIALLVLVMGVPIADVAWQIVQRVRARRSPLSADRGHLHLRLADRGWGARRITATYVLVSASLGTVALLPLSPLSKLIAISATFAAAFAALSALSALPTATPQQR